MSELSEKRKTVSFKVDDKTAKLAKKLAEATGVGYGGVSAVAKQSLESAIKSAKREGLIKDDDLI